MTPTGPSQKKSKTGIATPQRNIDLIKRRLQAADVAAASKGQTP